MREFIHSGDKVVQLIGRKLGIHGQRKDFVSQRLGDGKSAKPRISELLISGGQMKWNGIVDTRVNAALSKETAELVATVRTNNEEMEIVFAVRWNDGRTDPIELKGVGEHARVVDAHAIPFTEMAQFHREDSGLKRIEPGVGSDGGVMIFSRTAMIA